MKRPLLILLLTLILVACAKVPITGRKQLNLLPESQMMSMSLGAYQDFLKENDTKVLPDDHPKTRMVREVGNNIARAATAYLKENGQADRVKDFNWAFNVVDDPTKNAWCMSGGKVVFYTGILEVCQTPTGIAVVMGHEIAHAVARHGNERMSQQVAIQAGGTTLSVLTQEKPELTRNILLRSYGVASQLGSLKYSRTHESEADKMGLVFMAKAGYNPEEAVAFWLRMNEAGGEAPPEFLSTHPSHESRVDDLKAFMPEAKKYYEGD